MCRHCSTPAPAQTRRSFVRLFALGAVAASAGLGGARSARAAAAPATQPIKARAGWARLITPNPFWLLHGEQDGRIASFLAKEAKLGVEPRNYAVDPANLDELLAFPLIAANGLDAIVEPAAFRNIKAYLERGGCFYLEGCLDHRITRSFAVFLAAQIGWLKKLFPEAKLRRFAATHPIHRARFPVAEASLALVDPQLDETRWKDVPQALYGIYHDERLLAIVSLQHLQCEWFTQAEKIPHALQQIANLYTYAITR